MLKSFNEMLKVDVLPFCDMRDAKDDSGRNIKVPYLNWAKCKKLLHDNGAEYVNFEPVVNENGSSLIMSEIPFTDKNGVINRCYEVRVKVYIDDKVYEGQYPLMNGSNPVKDNSMSQQRVWTAITRAFVKTVAMVTGLGFGLWCDFRDEADDAAPADEDLSRHSLAAIQERFKEEYTDVLKKKNLSSKEVADALEMSVDEVKAVFAQFDTLARFEAKLLTLKK